MISWRSRISIVSETASTPTVPATRRGEKLRPTIAANWTKRRAALGSASIRHRPRT